MPGEQTGRHTNAIPRNIELNLNCTELEQRAIDYDKMNMSSRTKFHPTPVDSDYQGGSRVCIYPEYFNFYLNFYFNFYLNFSESF